MNKPLSYYAEIDWKQEVPSAKLYADIYYSDVSGWDEAQYVFLEHNQIAQRIKALPQNGRLVIGETGFGCGLNFLATLKLWQELNSADSNRSNRHLDFISIEKHPVHPTDLRQILATFPQTKKYAAALLQQYSLLLPGFHRFHFSHNINLTLIIDDVCSGLEQLQQKVDAWFLDGFSPAKNAAMWCELVFKQIARLSHLQSTFATYTASSQVRSGLNAYGFNVIKVKGFGRKREMLYGQMISLPLPEQKTSVPKYFEFSTNQITQRDVAIIGAGLSGAATAYSLAQRGYKVRVYEQNPAPALAASGNFQGILYGTWSAFANPGMELSCAAYRYSHNLIRELLIAGQDYVQNGLIQLAHNPAQAKRNWQLANSHLPADFLSWVEHPEIESISGLKLSGNHSGIFFPSALWLKPPAMVHKLLEHPNISLITTCQIQKIEYQDKAWQLYTAINQKQSMASSPLLILCNAHEVNQLLPPQAELPIRKIRGQVSVVSAQNQLQTILCGNGYIIPSINQQFTLGATFNFNDLDPSVRMMDHHQNLANFAELLPELISAINPAELAGKTAFRASPTDYLPLVGPLARYAEFQQDFAKLSIDKNLRFKCNCLYYPGLYLNVAHGAKGILTAPYCGEIIADYIDNTQLACSESLRQALHPNRFYARDLIKQCTLG